MTQALATVYVVDDDASHLVAMSRLLRASGHAVKTFSSSADFLQNLPAFQSGCVVADLRMPGLSGLELQAALARTRNPLPILFLTGHGDIPTSVQAMRQGAEDFLTKNTPKGKLLDAVARALARDARERSARDRLDDLCRRFDALTDREKQVLQHVLRGQMNKQIAADLSIHERTVKLHRAAIMSKLGVHSVAELSKLWVEAGNQMP